MEFLPMCLPLINANFCLLHLGEVIFISAAAVEQVCPRQLCCQPGGRFCSLNVSPPAKGEGACVGVGVSHRYIW